MMMFSKNDLFKPLGWVRAALPVIKADLQEYQCGFPLICSREVNRHWESISGQPIDETNFTTTMPIHNESCLISNCLKTYLASTLPVTESVAHIFVVNGSTDDSFQIAKGILEDTGVGIDWPQDLDTSYDKGIVRKHAYRLHNQNLALLIETTTCGKASAQNLANELALQRQSPLLISTDANNWVEPHTIAEFYGKNCDVVIKEHAASITFAKVINVNAAENCLGKLKNNYQKNIIISGDDRPGPGCLIGWDPAWLKSVGGVPLCALEDFALSVVASVRGNGIKHTDAKIWALNTTTPFDILESNIRSARGVQQTQALFLGQDDLLKKVKDWSTLALPVHKRLQRYHENLKEVPLSRRIFSVIKYAMLEFANTAARFQNYRNPTNISWKPISSTKHISFDKDKAHGKVS